MARLLEPLEDPRRPADEVPLAVRDGDVEPFIVLQEGAAARRGLQVNPAVLESAGEAERALIAEADLVVAIGVDAVEMRREAWPRAKPLLELTPVTPESPSDDRVVVVGDIGTILEELAPRLRAGRFAEWDVARLRALKQAASAPPVAPRPLAAHRAVEAARRLMPPGTLAVLERGDVWGEAARAWHAVAPGECLISAGPATEGFAVVAAAAAQLASPHRRVVCFTEPRAIGPGHLATVTALGVPVLIVVPSPFAPPPNLPSFVAPSVASLPGLLEAALGRGGPTVLVVDLP